MECPRRPCSRRQVSRPRTPAKILRRSGRRKRLFQKSAIGAPLGYGSLDTCLRWERINCSTGMIATADTDERHSGKPESPDALPQQNRYPKQVVASNKMLPESRIYPCQRGQCIPLRRLKSADTCGVDDGAWAISRRWFSCEGRVWDSQPPSSVLRRKPQVLERYPIWCVNTLMVRGSVRLPRSSPDGC